MENSAYEHRISRLLHRVGDLTARSSAAVLVAVIVIGFGVFLAITGFSGRWESNFSTVATSITLVMLFVIQHTQSRQQTATQLKLDELIRASPEADDLLVHIEAAPAAELTERVEDQIAHHEALRENGESDEAL